MTERILFPIAKEFNPDLIFVSSGFDSARGDPLGDLSVDPEGYAYMLGRLMELAEGRIGVALEGGYNLDSISVSAEACVRTLLGETLPMKTCSRSPLVTTEQLHDNCCPILLNYLLAQDIIAKLRPFWPILD